jgi:hypothetical protein
MQSWNDFVGAKIGIFSIKSNQTPLIVKTGCQTETGVRDHRLPDGERRRAAGRPEVSIRVRAAVFGITPRGSYIHPVIMSLNVPVSYK